MNNECKSRSSNLLLWLGSFAILLTLAMPAFAALGGDLSSVESDRVHMKAQISITPAGPYSVHVIKSDLKTTVREYVSPSGRVFAVAWNGPFMPDMKQILGTYFQQYSSGAQTVRSSRPGRHPFSLQVPGLVVENSGHMRFYVGRAYDPGLLPSGVTADAIR